MFDLSLARTSVRAFASSLGKVCGTDVTPSWSCLVPTSGPLAELPRDGGTDALWFLLGDGGATGYRYECLDMLPHLLVAGTTGSGKSVFLNSLLASLLTRHTPASLLLGLVDPKQVELAGYGSLPHLGGRGVVTEIRGAASLMDWAVGLMEHRLGLFVDRRVKSLASYNALPGVSVLPRVVLVVDEFADLILSGRKDRELRGHAEAFELGIIRLAQKARAAGIHLVLATQKPIVKVVDSLLKGNIPSRISFRVTNEVESRVILDVKGAEVLAGRGDMLFKSPVENGLERLRGVMLPEPFLDMVVRGV